jgi:DNA-binding XRE family transcriptional regulator
MNSRVSGKNNLPGRGRAPHQEVVRNTLLDRRKTQEISRAELAAQAGLTRQAIYAIEANQYVPSTHIALRLARALKIFFIFKRMRKSLKPSSSAAYQFQISPCG